MKTDIEKQNCIISELSGMISEFDNGTDPDSLALDRIFSEEEEEEK